MAVLRRPYLSWSPEGVVCMDTVEIQQHFGNMTWGAASGSPEHCVDAVDYATHLSAA
jgi:hypothetical protein